MQDGKFSINIGGWPLGITILLCILKLINIINISWWWCFCPIWLPFVIGAVLIILIILVAIIYAVTEVLLENSKK
jgi:hypothetical protein